MLVLNKLKNKGGARVVRIWEYKVVDIMEGLEEEAVEATMPGGDTSGVLAKIEKRLKKLGKDGWELASQEKQISIFKREGK